MLWLILLILLIVLLVAAVPTWPHSSGWGYSPAGVLALIIVVLLLLWLIGVIEFRDTDNDVTTDGANVEEESRLPSAAALWTLS